MSPAISPFSKSVARDPSHQQNFRSNRPGKSRPWPPPLRYVKPAHIRGELRKRGPDVMFSLYEVEGTITEACSQLKDDNLAAVTFTRVPMLTAHQSVRALRHDFKRAQTTIVVKTLPKNVTFPISIGTEREGAICFTREELAGLTYREFNLRIHQALLDKVAPRLIPGRA